MAVERVKRLKDLIHRLERLPASPDRDRVLSEVRSRAVDLDTGVMPRAMLAVREPPPPPIPPKPPKRDRASSITRTAPPPSARAVERAPSPFALGPSEDLEQTVCLDERLSLEDSPLPHVRAAQGNRGVRPWTLGLRA
jgi:hypothetical protein